MKQLVLLAIFTALFYGCGREPIEEINLEQILGSDIIAAKQINPKEINLYVDLSSSMKNYLNQSLITGSDYYLYENYIRNIFSQRQDAKINIYGFGDDIYFLGSNDDAIQSLINQNTYDKSMTKINQVFDKIQKDTSQTLNFVLSDALYEEDGVQGNTLGFLMSPYIKSQVSKKKLFGLFAKNLGYYGIQNKKVFNSPLYLFVFGEYSHNTFLTSNYSGVNDDFFIIAPNFKYSSKISLSPNINLLMQKSKYVLAEVDDYTSPVNIKISFEREIGDNLLKSNILNDKYEFVIFEKLIHYDEQKATYVGDTEWSRSPLNDPQCSLLNKYNNDTTKQILTLEFNKSFKEQSNFKIYRIAVLSKIHKNLIDKYNTDNPDNIQKTYRFNDFFVNLQNHLNENPVPLFTYFIVIK